MKDISKKVSRYSLNFIRLLRVVITPSVKRLNRPAVNAVQWRHYSFALSPSSETKGQSVGSGERARRKFSSTGERAPGHGYRLSPSYFQKFKRIPAPDWAQKMLCIIVPNRRTVSPEFFSWVRTRRLLSCHTCPVRSPSLCEQGKLLFSTFLTRNEGTTDESKKRLGCYQQEQFNLPREYSVFDSSQCIVNNRKIKMRRRWESQISNSLTRQNNNFARASRFFVHFFAVNCTTTRENA